MPIDFMTKSTISSFVVAGANPEAQIDFSNFGFVFRVVFALALITGTGPMLMSRVPLTGFGNFSINCFGLLTESSFRFGVNKRRLSAVMRANVGVFAN